MGEVLVIILSVLFGGGGVVSLIGYVVNKRQSARRAREEVQSRHAAYLREVYASLLANTRKLKIALDDLKPIHDDLMTRFIYSPFTKPAAERQMRDATNGIIECNSKLALHPGTEGVRQAFDEFIYAWEAFGLALDKPIRTFTKKANAAELLQLEATMNAKLKALQDATQAHLSALETSSASSPWVKRMITTPLSRLRQHGNVRWLQGQHQEDK